MDNLKHERDVCPMRGAHHLSTTYNLTQYKAILYNTIKHKIERVKFYDMDSHALMTRCMASLCQILSQPSLYKYFYYMASACFDNSRHLIGQFAVRILP